MTTIQPLLPGTYPRSQTLVQTTRDYDRNRTTKETLHEHQTRDTEALIGTQTLHHYPTPATGHITWQDPFRPLTPLLNNIQPDTLTRFLDTNTFYRQPTIQDEPTLKADALPTFLTRHAPRIPTQNGLTTLPSPTAWITANKTEHDTYPNTEHAHTLARTLYPTLLERLHERGTRTIALTDPWLSTHPNPTPLLETLTPLHNHHDTPHTLLLHLPFQNATPHLEHIHQQPLHGTLIDLHQTPHDALENHPTDRALGIGIIDARASLLEREDLLIATIDETLETTQPHTLYITPTGPLEHLPEPIARKKLRLLGQTAHTAQRKLQGDHA